MVFYLNPVSWGFTQHKKMRLEDKDEWTELRTKRSIILAYFQEVKSEDLHIFLT